MNNTKNALAELAEQMKSPVELMPGTGDSLVGLNRNQLEAYKKAQRIIAELAKVSSGHWENICDGPPAYICDASDLKVGCCIGRCRAIAEEGGEDGK